MSALDRTQSNQAREHAPDLIQRLTGRAMAEGTATRHDGTQRTHQARS